MPVRPRTHSAQIYLHKNIAIKAGKAHSRSMDTVFPYAFWTLLVVIFIGLGVAILVW
jgi:hypothetical protein